MIEPITSSLLNGLSSIRHAFFTRERGVSQGLYASLNGGLGSNDDPNAVRENRARMARSLGLEPTHLLSLYQIHSAQVEVVEAPWGEERPQADALVTNRPGLGLAIATADCGPVLFADPEAGVIGAAHAGWKGATGGVLEATLVAMEQLGARRTHITAALGPTISQGAYEVGPDFIKHFRGLPAPLGAADDFLTSVPREGHALFNLPGYIAARLKAAGIKAFEDVALCTYADEARFYSYRRATHRGEGDYGRLISAVVLDENRICN